MKIYLSQLLGRFLTFDSRVPETSGVATFKFQPDPKIKWEAGQYYVYFMPGDLLDRRTPLRPFTVSSAPGAGSLQLTTRIVRQPSSFKRQLLALKPGAKVYAFGPFGSFTLKPRRPVVMLAGGIGITPFRAQLTELASAGPLPDTTLLYANRDENILFRQELDALARANRQLKIQYLIGDNRLSAAAIRAHVSQIAGSDFYISGPKPMVESLSQMLRAELQVPAGQIHRDSFKGYPWPLSQ
ncbi:MAG: hypothetical protein NVS3B29_07820 [Candidatus Saccharimonadales bacterium]